MTPKKDKQNQREEHCGSCNQEFDEGAQAIQCEGACELWHHKDCAGLKQGEFDIMSKSNCNLTWICKTCKSAMHAGTEISSTDDKIKYSATLHSATLVFGVSCT
ncbi:hypothetical protein C0J52_08023 [Blattella germanica]|nr:hypothetical protein C0J52_08023 [Blattella germanica]